MKEGIKSMYEFHGWAVLCYHTHDTNEELQEEAVDKFKQYIKKNDLMNVLRLNRYNGQDSIIISGLHNHFKEYVIDMFEWLAQHTIGSYGLLYIHDDEDAKNENEFVVWRLARGTLTKYKDIFLSPCIPTIEDTYDPTRDD